MDFKYLFMSLDGRINRAKYWIGWLIVALISAVLSLSLAAWLAFRGAPFGPGYAVATLIVGLILAYPLYAVTAKRFQDRGRPGLLALFGVATGLAYSALQMVGVVDPPIPDSSLDPSIPTVASGMILMGIELWFLVELAGLRGTPGPNQYGPNPLGASQAEPTFRRPMKELLWIVFGFTGRIRRLAFWGLTFAIPVAVGIVFARVNLVAEGFGYEIANAESAFYILVGIVFLLVAVLYLWASYAISVKRLHDRDHSGWWVVAPTALFLLADLTWSLGEAPQRASALPVAIGLIGFGVGIWLFVEVGFLRGTQGPNRYGPDPLGQTQADAAL